MSSDYAIQVKLGVSGGSVVATLIRVSILLLGRAEAGRAATLRRIDLALFGINTETLNSMHAIAFRSVQSAFEFLAWDPLQALSPSTGAIALGALCAAGPAR